MARKELCDSMRRFLLLILVALAGCQQAVPTQRPIQSQKTTVALRTLTPQATATDEPTATTEPTPTTKPAEVTKPVSSPTPAKAATPTPVVTPATSPAGDHSYCTQQAGTTGQERFSARLTTLTLTRTGSFDVLTLGFDDLAGALGANAACVAPNDALSLLSSTEITSVLRLELPLWAHDEAWLASQITLTTPLSFEGTSRVRGVNVLTQGDRSAGLIVELGVNQHVPFELRLTSNQLVLTIADAPILLNDDPLGQAQGRTGNPVQPLIYNQGGDLWLLDGASVKALKLTPELETDFALSPNRSQVAFCRVEAGLTAELGSLWVSDIDGSDERQLADIGGCVDPAWAFDGSAVWFAAPWNDIQPLAFRVWEVPLNGEPQQRSGLDEWSRTRPQPLPKGDVLMIGTDAVGGSTILLHQATTGTSIDLGGDLRSKYIGVADLMVAPDGSQAAASALRVDGGADLIWLDPSGTITQTVGTDMWWTRPLAWGNDGTLYSLASACQAGRVLSYTLYEHSKQQTKPLADGHTLAAIGDAVVADTGLVFVRETLSNGGERGPAPTITGPSQLWLLNPKTGGRELLLATPHPLLGVR